MKRKTTIRPAKDFIAAPEGSDTAEILLYEEIGDIIPGFAVASEIQRLMLEKETIAVRINSPGGIIMDGMSIYTAMRRAQEEGVKVPTYIDGVAASISSFIAVGGSTVNIEKVLGKLMIHEPFNPEDENESVEASKTLQQFMDIIVGVIKRRTDWAEDRIRQELKDETWYDAETAANEGLADNVYELGIPEPDTAQLETEDRAEFHKVAASLIKKARNKTSSNGGGKDPNPQPQPQPRSTMKLTNVLSKLGLKEDANEASIEQAVNQVLQERDDANNELKSKKDELKKATDELKALKDQQAKNEVDQAIKAGKFNSDQRETLEAQATKDPEGFRAMANAIPPQKQGSPSEDIRNGNGAGSEVGGGSEPTADDPQVKARMPKANFREMRKNHNQELERLRKEDYPVFKALYKDWFGVEPGASRK